MKNLILLTALLFSGFVWSQQNVKWPSLNMASPTNQFVADISAVDAQTVWGVCWKANFTGNNIFRTTDGGLTYDLFQLPTTATDALIYQVFAIDADSAYAAVCNGNGNNVEGIFRTKDGGNTWSLVFNATQEGLAVFQVHFFDGQAGVLMGNTFTGDVQSIFYYTQDGGDTWTKSSTQFTSTCLYIESGGKNYAAIGDTIWYAGGIKNMIFQSVDKGQTWTRQALPMGIDASIQDIAFKNSLEGLALSSFRCGFGDTDKLIFQTMDGGQTWTHLTTISFPFYLAEANNIEYIPGTAGAYITTSGVEPGSKEGFFTLDNGQTWKPIWAPSEVFVMDFLSPTLGFAGTFTKDGGLLSYDDTLFSISNSIEEQIRLNKHLTLFPNPTSDILNLELSNGWRGKMTLTCYNMHGKQLFSEELYKQTENMHWEVFMQAYPAGRYQIVLSDGKEIVAQPFILR